MKINNINKKLIASLLAITLTMPVAGCSMKQNTEVLEVDSKQDVQIDEYLQIDNSKDELSIKIDDLKQCQAFIYDNGTEVEVDIVIDKDGQYYSIIDGTVLNGIGYNQYYGMFKYDADSNSVTPIKKVDVSDYIYKYDRVPSEYTEQQIHNIMRIISSEYKLQKEGKIDYFKMEQTEQGYRSVNTISYENLKDDKLLFVHDPLLGPESVYVYPYLVTPRDGDYYNVMGGILLKDIFSERFNIETVNLNDYLVSYDKIQPEYNENQVYEIVNQVISDYEKRLENATIIK